MRFLKASSSKLSCEQAYYLKSHPFSGKMLGSMKTSEQKETSAQLYASIMKHRLKGIMIIDLAGKIKVVNEAFSKITGYAEKEVIGKNPTFLYSGRQGEHFYKKMWHHLSADGEWQGEIWNRRKNGTIYPEWLSISGIRDETGKIGHYVAIFSDITERKLSEERLVYLAHHDILTDLPNRRLLEERLAQSIKQAERKQQKLAILSIDLDQFKQINEAFGRPIGDELLITVADRLKSTVRDSDTISRLSGDTFAILLTESSEIEHTATIAQKILHLLSKPISLDRHQPIAISGSIGISLYPSDGTDSKTLFTHADQAMRRVKKRGRNGYQFYSEEIGIHSLERIELKMAIRRALEQDEFELYYQPKLDLKTGAITCLESLIRWRHPEKGLILPDAFIPMAEETNLIIPIGEWGLRIACEQAKKWRDKGLPPLRMGVNFSARQFQQENLLENVLNVLRETKLEPEFLELEITESIAMDQVDKGIQTMNELNQIGIRLAIDDFGIGYSSLGYLRQFPVHALKIDQSFIKNLPKNKDDAAITAAIIAMGHNLNLEVIAEGVETKSELGFLQQHECDGVQGFYLSQPLPADLLEAFLIRGTYKTLLTD